MKKLLGERLLETGLIREQQLAEALQAQQRTGEQLGRLLVRLGYLENGALLQVLCEDAGVPFSPLDDAVIDPAALRLLPESLARASTALPLRFQDGRLVVAMADPFDAVAIQSLERATGRRLAPLGAPRDRVAEVLDRAYREADARTAPSASEVGLSASIRPAPFLVLEDGAEPGPEVAEIAGTAARTTDEIFQRAIALGATDIHIEPTSDSVRVRFRLDGILRPGPVYPKAQQPALLTRIKVLASLNVAESRLPQDGRLRLRIGGRDIDLRISTFPTLHGEDLVLRVLDRERVPLHLDSLGLPRHDLQLFREVLGRPLGLVLITGPTGSGKTTTLYSALGEVNQGDRCILTLEDPIEYELEGVRQSQVNPRAGLTFASGLRSMLRHDPDVILVGEIRDEETAQICLSAAMTGHMVLSTLHTNTAAGAVTRLLDLGVEPFTLASSLQLCIAQRLVRVLCPSCRQPADVPPAVRRRLQLEDVAVFQAVGCPECGQTGYRGRVAIFEFLPMSEAVSESIYERRPAEEIQRRSRHPSLLQSGLAQVRAGRTTLEELFRIVSL